MDNGTALDKAAGVSTDFLAGLGLAGVLESTLGRLARPAVVPEVAPEAPAASGRVPLSQRDPQRLFTKGQKQTIFERDNYHCVRCTKGTTEPTPYTKGSKHLPTERVAGHKQAWSEGGRTTVENSQTECRGCSLRGTK